MAIGRLGGNNPAGAAPKDNNDGTKKKPPIAPKPQISSMSGHKLQNTGKKLTTRQIDDSKALDKNHHQSESDASSGSSVEGKADSSRSETEAYYQNQSYDVPDSLYEDIEVKAFTSEAEEHPAPAEYLSLQELCSLHQPVADEKAFNKLMMSLGKKSNKIDKDQAIKLLDCCTLEQWNQLSEHKNVPVGMRPLLNRRLLANVLQDFLLSPNDHQGMFTKLASVGVIKAELKGFDKQRISPDTLADPIAASHLFKNLQQRQPVFDKESFQKLSDKLVNDKEGVLATLEEELKQSLQRMDIDQKDQFKVSMKVMVDAYGKAKEGLEAGGLPSKLEAGGLPSKLKAGGLPSKQGLAMMFAQSIFTITYAEDKDVYISGELMQIPGKLMQMHGELMQMLLRAGLYKAA